MPFYFLTCLQTTDMQPYDYGQGDFVGIPRYENMTTNRNIAFPGWYVSRPVSIVHDKGTLNLYLNNIMIPVFAGQYEWNSSGTHAMVDKRKVGNDYGSWDDLLMFVDRKTVGQTSTYEVVEDRDKNEQAAAAVHDSWMSRPVYHDAKLMVAYAELPEVEKEKDRAHVRMAKALLYRFPAMAEEEMGAMLGSQLHEQWRVSYDPTGSGKPRMKNASNSNSTQVDINVPWGQLNATWQKDNLSAGVAAVQIVRRVFISEATLSRPSSLYREEPLQPRVGGGRKVGRGGAKPAKAKPAAKWVATGRKVLHKGAQRQVWRSSGDPSKLAVKRVAKAADGSRKVRYEVL